MHMRRHTPVFALTGVLAAWVVILFMYPPVADMWYHSNAYRSGEFRDPLAFYAHQFLAGNPRIGEIALYLGGGVAAYRALAGLAGVALLLFASAKLLVLLIPTGFKRPAVAEVALILLALAALLVPRSGVVFFYLPLNANYVLGYGFMVLFLLALLVVSREEATDRRQLFLLSLAGLAAGLSNEHTPPTFIALIAFMIAGCVVIKKRVSAALYVGLLALLIGFALLYFAPGQSVRYYEGAKTEGLRRLIPNLLTVFSTAPPTFYLIIFALLVGSLVWFRRSKDPRDLVPAASSISAVSLLATTAASPFLGERLVFAAYFTACFGGAWAILRAAPSAKAPSIVVAVAFLLAYSVQSLERSLIYRVEFNERLERLEVARASGATEVELPRYRVDYTADNHILWPEAQSQDPEHLHNRLLAGVFGLERVTISP